jgi:hypothetical protein
LNENVYELHTSSLNGNDYRLGLAEISLKKIPTLLEQGDRGYFLEVGHEIQNQKNLWNVGFTSNGFAFSGDTEVMCNILQAHHWKN